MRRTYQRTLPSDSSKDYYFIHRNTGKTEPVIVEYGFIDDTSSNYDFLNNNYQELAEAVIKSILEYKGLTYSAPSSTSSNTYTVKKGDTLYSIANKYNTTVDTLKELNNLTSNLLTVGQSLVLPSSTNIYTVVKGDTLYSIANLNNTTVDEIKELNNLTSDVLSIGQTLKIPSTENVEVITTTTYTVKKGDTLYSIAKNYDTIVSNIKTLNNLTSDTLTIGQVLQIPVTTTAVMETNTITYTVKAGDTLYSLAREYNTTVNNIKTLNNLSSDILSIGQTLLISS